MRDRPRPGGGGRGRRPTGCRSPSPGSSQPSITNTAGSPPSGWNGARRAPRSSASACPAVRSGANADKCAELAQQLAETPRRLPVRRSRCSRARAIPRPRGRHRTPRPRRLLHAARGPRDARRCRAPASKRTGRQPRARTARASAAGMSGGARPSLRNRAGRDCKRAPRAPLPRPRRNAVRSNRDSSVVQSPATERMRSASSANFDDRLRRAAACPPARSKTRSPGVRQFELRLQGRPPARARARPLRAEVRARSRRARRPAPRRAASRSHATSAARSDSGSGGCMSKRERVRLDEVAVADRRSLDLSRPRTRSPAPASAG